MSDVIKKPSPSVIRLIKAGDELAVFDTIVLGHGDNGLWPLSGQKIIKLIDAAVSPNTPERGYKPTIGIIDGPNGIEAMTCLQLDQMWYTESWYLSEMFNFVHPDYRRSKHVQALMAFQRQFADNMSKAIGSRVTLITGVMTKKRLEAKMHLFGRRYPQIGAIFAYNLDDANASETFNQRHAETIRSPAPVETKQRRNYGG